MSTQIGLSQSDYVRPGAVLLRGPWEASPALWQPDMSRLVFGHQTHIYEQDASHLLWYKGTSPRLVAIAPQKTLALLSTFYKDIQEASFVKR